MRCGRSAGLFWLVFFSLIFLAAPLHAQAGGDSYFCAQESDCGEGFSCEGGVCVPACQKDGQACQYSSDCCSGTCDEQAGQCRKDAGSGAIDYGDIYLWVGLSVAVAAAFIGLSYMAAKLFSLQLLDAWTKIELQELMASLIIAVFCVALIAGLDSAAKFLSNEPSAISAAGSFLRDRVYADGRTIYRQVAFLYYNAARISSYSFTAGQSVEIMSISYSASPAAGLSGLIAEMGQALDSVANFMLLAAAQYSFLQFFRTAAAVMLPVGIFLRSFSLTRKIGGMVLAAVIASSVIYPASFSVSSGIYSAFSPDMLSKASQARPGQEAGNPPLSDVICSPFMQAFVMSPIPFLGGEFGWATTICTPVCAITAAVGGFPACWKSCYNIVQTVFYVIKSTFPVLMSYPLLNYISENATPAKLVANYYDPALKFALPAVAQYAVLSLAVFLIPLIIALVLLRNLAITFGGEPQLYGLSKLV